MRYDVDHIVRRRLERYIYIRSQASTVENRIKLALRIESVFNLRTKMRGVALSTLAVFGKSLLPNLHQLNAERLRFRHNYSCIMF